MEISNQIIEVLNAISDKVGIAIDWSPKNIIPYLQQISTKYFHYKISLSILWLILSMGIIVFGFILKRKLDSNKEFGITKYHTMKDDNSLRNLSIVGIFAVFLIGIIIIIFNIITILTCLTFPEKIILDDLISLIK